MIHPLESRLLGVFLLPSVFLGCRLDPPGGHGQPFPFQVLIVLATVSDITYARALSRRTRGKYAEAMAEAKARK
jgi:hypothetical protein